jgi:O-antigen/teichoic acid export membrane protein
MRQAWYGGIFAGAVSAGALAITAVFVPTPIALVIVYIISNLGATIYAYSQVFAYYKPNSSKIDPDMMRYAKHMSIIGILGTIAGNVDQILLYHFGGTVNLAIYNFSIGVLDQVKGPLKTLDSMLQARFATRTNLSIDAGIANKMKWLGLLSITSIIVYIPLAPHIYAILFPTYTESILLSQVYALSLLSLVFTPAISYLAAKKRVRALYTLSLTGNALQIAAMAIGVIGWGLWGLVISRVVVRILGAFIGFILYRLDTKI